MYFNELLKKQISVTGVISLNYTHLIVKCIIVLLNLHINIFILTNNMPTDI
jgi:hypothetical protein